MISMPGSSTEKTLAISAEKVDYSKIFHASELMGNKNRLSFESRIFLIPFSEIQKVISDVAFEKLKEDIHEEDIKESRLTSKERVGCWRKRFPVTKVYEVEGLSPLRIIGMKTMDFKKEYGSTTCLLDDIKGLGPKEKVIHENNQSRNADASESSQLRVAYPERKQVIMGEAAFDFENTQNFKTHVEITNLFQNLKTALAKSVNAFGSKLFPNESMLLIWDSLAQQILDAQKFDQEVKEKYSKLLLKYWEKISYSMMQIATNGFQKKYKQADDNLQATIDRLKNLRDFLSITDSKTFFTQLEEMQQPLIKFFESIRALTKDDGKDYFYHELYAFQNNQNLTNWGSLTIHLDSSKKCIRKWLEARSNILELYIRLVEPNSNDWKQHLHCIRSIKEAFRLQHWIFAYKNIMKLTDGLMRSSWPKKMNVFRDKDITFIPEIDEKDFEKSRCWHFSCVLLEDFLYIIKRFKTFDLVSEFSKDELKLSYQSLKSPLPDFTTTTPQFLKWIKAIKQSGYPELFEAVIALGNSWKVLKGIKNDLMDKDLQILLEELFKQLDTENVEQLSNSYLAIAKKLTNPFELWKEGLKNINENVRRLQNFCVFILKEPHLEKINSEDLRQQFKILNKRLKEFAFPITQFFASFQNLMFVNDNQLPKGTSQLMNDEELKIIFFDVRTSYFKALAQQMKELSELKETVIEIEHSSEEVSEEKKHVENEFSENKAEENSEEFTNKLSQIFQKNKKTRKILKNVKELFNEYNLHFSSKYGKGDHLKIYVNGILIVVPDHKEWKPGTHKSILEDFKQIQNLITEKEKDNK